MSGRKAFSEEHFPAGATKRFWAQGNYEKGKKTHNKKKKKKKRKRGACEKKNLFGSSQIRIKRARVEEEIGAGGEVPILRSWEGGKGAILVRGKKKKVSAERGESVTALRISIAERGVPSRRNITLFCSVEATETGGGGELKGKKEICSGGKKERVNSCSSSVATYSKKKEEKGDKRLVEREKTK